MCKEHEDEKRTPEKYIKFHPIQNEGFSPTMIACLDRISDATSKSLRSYRKISPNMLG